ncbi:DUF4232 domain-containing protein [Streptomyces aureus]|uniref:DUF4232 domain-containing protein n=1 Tax=Streptomyces aureus TaxID=193461 RepID=UPI0036888DD0
MNTSARRNRTSPRRWTSYALGATAAATLLATTACGHGTVKDAEGSTSSERPSASASAKRGGASADAGGTSAGRGGSGGASAGSTNGTSGTGRTGGKGTTGGTGGTSATGRTGSTGSGGGTAGGTGGGGKAAIAPCTQKELGVSAVKERDARHLALTVQNASTEKCNLYGYPTVQLGADAQFTTPVIKDSDGTPGEPVTLDPGQEAYAALLVSSGTTNEYAAKSITLSLQGPTSGSSADGPIDVPMPVGTLYADNSQLVTYWTTASGFALRFIMSK